MKIAKLRLMAGLVEVSDRDEINEAEFDDLYIGQISTVRDLGWVVWDTHCITSDPPMSAAMRRFANMDYAAYGLELLDLGVVQKVVSEGKLHYFWTNKELKECRTL